MHCINSHWDNLIFIYHSLWIWHQLTLTSLVRAPNILFVYSQVFYLFLFFVFCFFLMKFFTASPSLVWTRFSACLSFLWINSISRLQLSPLSFCLFFAFYLEVINHFKVAKWITLLPATHMYTRTQEINLSNQCRVNHIQHTLHTVSSHNNKTWESIFLKLSL